ncbi:MAG: LacI family DNA-binding transcriptional regulator [Paracoccaceae bacterium]
MMNPRVTLQDVAREANVSPATVDRVLNSRDGVRPRTREAVLATALRLGYVTDGTLPPTKRPQTRLINLVFLLPSGTNSFIKALFNQIETQAARRPELAVHVETLEGFNPQTVAARLAELPGEVDGVGLVAQDHPLVREAIRALTRNGIPVVTIASDIQNVARLAYIGIDNRQAGRLAGQLIGRLLGRGPAKVALFAGSLSYRGHEEREMGFRHILREEFPAVQIVELREILDDRSRAVVETASVLDSHADLAGIYNVGGGTVGIAQEISRRGLSGKVVLIGHEATEANKQLLLEGVIDAVIDQNPRVEAREALNILTAAVRAEAYIYVPPRLQLVLKENLPNE